MSCNYAEGLSPYEHKGVLGVPEKFDSIGKLNEKCHILAELIKTSKHVVVHTGAGISTSAGIPDFRGPNGVWTLEKKGKKPSINVSFADAKPTKTHMILKKLVESDKVQYIISQNIDGLHLKSGLSRKNLAELHGNMFIDECNLCKRQFVRSCPVETVGKKCSGVPCAAGHAGGRPCRGRLYDGVLDWEHSLPENDLIMSELHSSLADLSICLGTTLQIIPSGNLPLETVKYGGKLVICNLQPTKHFNLTLMSSYSYLLSNELKFGLSIEDAKGVRWMYAMLAFPKRGCILPDDDDYDENPYYFQDNKADLVINYYVDDVLDKIMNILNLEIPEYNEADNFMKLAENTILDWTIKRKDVLALEKVFKVKCKGVKKKRILVKKRNSSEIGTSSTYKSKMIKLEDKGVKGVASGSILLAKNKGNRCTEIVVDDLSDDDYSDIIKLEIKEQTENTTFDSDDDKSKVFKLRDKKVNGLAGGSVLLDKNERNKCTEIVLDDLSDDDYSDIIKLDIKNQTEITTFGDDDVILIE